MNNKLLPRNHRRRTFAASLAGLPLFAISACSSEKEQVLLARLEVSEDGNYTLDGSAVSKEGLRQELIARRPEKGKFELRVVATPKTKYEDVAYVMKTAQEVGVQVGIVGNERF